MYILLFCIKYSQINFTRTSYMRRKRRKRRDPQRKSLPQLDHMKIPTLHHKDPGQVSMHIQTFFISVKANPLLKKIKYTALLFQPGPLSEVYIIICTTSNFNIFCEIKDNVYNKHFYNEQWPHIIHPTILSFKMK